MIKSFGPAGGSCLPAAAGAAAAGGAAAEAAPGAAAPGKTATGPVAAGPAAAGPISARVAAPPGRRGSIQPYVEQIRVIAADAPADEAEDQCHGQVDDRSPRKCCDAAEKD